VAAMVVMTAPHRAFVMMAVNANADADRADMGADDVSAGEANAQQAECEDRSDEGFHKEAPREGGTANADDVQHGVVVEGEARFLEWGGRRVRRCQAPLWSWFNGLGLIRFRTTRSRPTGR
jgi:hypothetical protein